jgi:hypothetical protein
VGMDDLPPNAAPDKPLTPAARRALEEAQARRVEIETAAANLPSLGVDREARGAGLPSNPEGAEQGGPKGLEPTRFGDWERKGIAVDF